LSRYGETDVAPPVVPTPVSVEVLGLFKALSVIVKVPDTAPVSTGVNVTDAEHENPEPNVAGDKGHVVALTANPADTLIPEIVSGVA